MADDTKNLGISVTDEEIGEIETGRTKQASIKISDLEAEIKSDEKALAEKKARLKEMEARAKERKKRTKALINHGLKAVEISGISWNELNLGDWLKDHDDKIRAEAIAKYKTENPGPDLDKIRTEAIQKYQMQRHQTAPRPITGAGTATNPARPVVTTELKAQPKPAAHPMAAAGDVVRSVAAVPN